MERKKPDRGGPIEPIKKVGRARLPLLLLLLVLSLTGCQPDDQRVCPVTAPVLATPPDDPAVSGPPAEGAYFVNQDRSIWASAGWADPADEFVKAGEEGVKVGWFRPAGATLEIVGRRIDAAAGPLEAQVPCCYPTQFQATGLYFPTAGCWEITAAAADRELTFVVSIPP